MKQGVQQHKRQKEDTNFIPQRKALFQYLQENIATASMVSAATGVPQKNVCGYKRDLEKEGRLWEIERKKCRHKGSKAWYLTTNPDMVPISNQLSLFES